MPTLTRERKDHARRAGERTPDGCAVVIANELSEFRWGGVEWSARQWSTLLGVIRRGQATARADEQTRARLDRWAARRSTR